MAVNDIYRGSGRDLPHNKPQTGGRADIWETHMGLFITVLVLAAICLIVIIVGLVCLRCKPRDRSEDRVSNVKATNRSLASYRLGEQAPCISLDI